jgi:DNA-binding NarL/FixJ family response regulator
MVTTVRELSPTVMGQSGEALSVLHINGGVLIRPRQADSSQVPAQPLTERELQVLALVAEGCSNKVIARHLGISERTVKNHLSYIMAKLGASDRTHAVVIAVRLGWLSI